jgi:hypothetical protein
MVLPEMALGIASRSEARTLEQPPGASGTRLKVAARPATVGATWQDLFHPGTPSPLGVDARVRVVADVAGALIHIHDNPGLPRPHRRHGRLTPRHLLVGVDGSASLFTAREPFSKLLPPQPDLGYLAPELLTQSGPATAQSDIFSLGVLLWEALDNGRLFPHRRAAAISRLIARRSLPMPRIEEEWALPLGDVAMKALSQDPAERHADAMAFWQALREHLPAPDAARSMLSRLAQRALKLELTSDIRDNPPFVGAAPPSRSLAPDAPDSDEAPARYSLRPEPSSRQTGLSFPVPRSEDPAWALSDVPPRSSELDLEPVMRESEPAPARPQSLRAPRSEAVPATPRRSSAPAPRAISAPASVRPEVEGAVSTLHVNLPRELIESSLPFYAPTTSAPRPFPWGALSFAALIFFGVGAAVAFGAVTALRGPAASERMAPVAPALPAVVPQAPVPAAPAPAPAPPSAVAPVAQTTTPQPTTGTTSPTPTSPTTASPAPSDPAGAPVADAPAAAAPAPTGAAAAPAAERAAPAPRKASKRIKPAKPRRAKQENAAASQGNTTETPLGSAAAELEQEPWSDPSADQSPTAAPATELPFVDQPY